MFSWKHLQKAITKHLQKGHHIGEWHFQMQFLNERDRIFIHISLKLFPKGSVDNKPSLVQVMTCHLFCAMPLPEPMMTQFIDAYMWR